MKITVVVVVIQIISSSMLIASTAKSQSLETTTISFELHKATVKESLLLLQKQSAFKISYPEQPVSNESKKIDLPLSQYSIAGALRFILKNTNLQFAQSNQYIIISQKPPKVLPGKITGKITDEKTGETLIGVIISVQGQSRVVQTDVQGKFELDLPEGNYEFSARYIGYVTEVFSANIKEGKTSEVNIRLKAQKNSLNEVVVVGYGTQKRSTITGAVNQVGSEVFENRPVTNAAQALQGVIPNLNITFSDGRPDRGGNFNIRGFTSINGGGPLILIDGVPADINQINPEDIATVSVLKDAASAAIYGARASFGVVLVTTKTGKKGKLDVRYSNNFGVSQPLGIPKVTDALTDATIQNEAYKGYSGSDNAGLVATIDYLKQRQANPSLPELGKDASGNFIRGANTDWYGSFYNKNLFFNKNYLSVAGGTEKTTYFLSGGFDDQDGIFKQETDHYKRYNLRAKLNFDFNQWLSLYNNAEFDQGNYDSPNTYVNKSGNNIYRYLSLFANPYEAIKTANGNWTQAGALTFGELQDGGRAETQNRTIRNTTGLQLKLFKNELHINGDYTVSYNELTNDTQSLPVSYETTPNVLTQYPNPNYYQSSYEQIFHSVANVYANYSHAFGKHQFTLLGGASQELNQDHAFNAYRENNITSSLGSLNLTSGPATVGDLKETWALQSLFYRANYGYDNKYLLELNGRYDGTSRFPSNDRFGFFPSVSGGWVLSKESFFKPLTNVFDNFKLRASYGTLGNQQVSAYPYISTMNVTKGTVILDGSQPLITSAPGLVSPNLTWETSTTADFGADMLLLHNRLELGFDWYQRQTRNMLTKSKSLPAVLGTAEPRTNAADLSTKGWELSAKWEDQFLLAGKTFRYNIFAVLSDNQSKITRYDNPNGLLSDYYTGQSIGEIWGYKTLGFFKTDDEWKTSASQSKVSSIEYQLNGHSLAGDIKFADLNGDNKIDNGTNTLANHGDQEKIGNTTPRYSYGFNAGFNWMSFDFSAFFQGVGKRDFWPGQESGVFWGLYNRYNQPVYTTIVNNYWTPQNTDAYFPRLRSYEAQASSSSLGVTQTRYLQNAAYLRLKNITLGYQLPAGLLQRINISSVRVFISGQNLVTWTKLNKAFDPEGIGQDPGTSTVNGTGFVYPIQKTFVAGLEVKF
ncbi:TonB-dependent receptor [Mucilaginibacter sp. UR6-11]|uniref:TonB-dependent receptor n=1 Tax=Mucilaginibacter sp. UR6-11 TaxID=1435644 RepID=UPI001E2BA6B2|nr:TonB-dependent receptor [Mucilaginibacter sp. UR6-11]MCC8424586.1 TonB-dependent receptor [Mucilaginibacter sp. UR6-11]